MFKYPSIKYNVERYTYRDSELLGRAQFHLNNFYICVITNQGGKRHTFRGGKRETYKIKQMNVKAAVAACLSAFL